MTVQHFDSRSICKVPACFTLLYSGDFCEFLLLLLFSASDLTSLRAVGWWRVSFYFSQPTKQKKAFGWVFFFAEFSVFSLRFAHLREPLGAGKLTNRIWTSQRMWWRTIPSPRQQHWAENTWCARPGCLLPDQKPLCSAPKPIQTSIRWCRIEQEIFHGWRRERRKEGTRASSSWRQPTVLTNEHFQFSPDSW